MRDDELSDELKRVANEVVKSHPMVAIVLLNVAGSIISEQYAHLRSLAIICGKHSQAMVEAIDAANN